MVSYKQLFTALFVPQIYATVLPRTRAGLGGLIGTYRLGESLGESSASHISLAYDSSGSLRAIRSDKVDVSAEKYGFERELYSVLCNGSGICPVFRESFVVKTDESKGKRFLVTDPSDITLEMFLRQGSVYSEESALNIVSQVAAYVTVLHNFGFSHNNIDVTTIAFKRDTQRSAVHFVDLTSAGRNIKGSAGMSFMNLELNPEKVYERYVRLDQPITDKNWFVHTAVYGDDPIERFIASPLSWSVQTKVAMRNCRIWMTISSHNRSRLNVLDSVHEILHGLVLPLDPPKEGESRENWFIWAMTRADEDSHIVNYLASRRRIFRNGLSEIILATRLLYRFVVHNEMEALRSSQLNVLRNLIGGNRVEEDFVISRFPNTDRTWFPWAVRDNNNDHAISGLMSRPEFTPLDRIAIRNSRIFERLSIGKAYGFSIDDSLRELYRYIVKTREPSTDESWFEWAIKYADSDSEIVNYLNPRSNLFSYDGADGIIYSTRLLYSLERRTQGDREDYIGIAKVFFQLQGVSEEQFMTLVRGGGAYATLSPTRRALLRIVHKVHAGRSIPDIDVLLSLLRREPFALTDDSEMFVQEPPSGNHKYTMIYLHGMGAIGATDWTEHIHRKTGGGFGDDVRVVIPQVKSTPRNPKREWFEFIEGREPWNSETPVGSLGDSESLEEATRGLLSLVDREARLLGGDYSRIYVMGYSKGGQMAVWLGLMGNRPLGVLSTIWDVCRTLRLTQCLTQGRMLL